MMPSSFFTSLVLFLPFAASAASAPISEVRTLATRCVSAKKEVSVTIYDHSDVLKSGYVDVVLNARLGTLFRENYLINDLRVVPDAKNSHRMSLHFTNGDITFDLIGNDEDGTASLAVADDARITLRCRDPRASR